MLRESFRNGSAGVAREMQLICKEWDFDIKEIRVPVTLGFPAYLAQTGNIIYLFSIEMVVVQCHKQR
jgi:hypothetical protein